jgi:hypothetical protein
MTSSESAWALLEVGSRSDMAVRRSEVTVAAGNVLHALDPLGNRHLLVPVADPSIGLEDDRSRGVTVSTRTLTTAEGEREQAFIDIKCEDVRLKDLFSKFCDELLLACKRAPEAAASATESVLERYRDLLGPGSRSLLTEEALRGLLAELHVLESVAAESPATAMQIWTGVDKMRHDFTGATASCEVKASIIIDEVKVRIHGLRQLEAPPQNPLYLLIERMEKVPTGGDCLPECIDRLEAAGLNRFELLTALSKVGVAAADLDAYSTVRFRLLERRAYLVGDDFPRLVHSMLKGHQGEDRISAVEYALDLTGRPPVPLSEIEVEDIPRRLTSGGELV